MLPWSSPVPQSALRPSTYWRPEHASPTTPTTQLGQLAMSPDIAKYVLAKGPRFKIIGLVNLVEANLSLVCYKIAIQKTLELNWSLPSWKHHLQNWPYGRTNQILRAHLQRP